MQEPQQNFVAGGISIIWLRKKKRRTSGCGGGEGQEEKREGKGEKWYRNIKKVAKNMQPEVSSSQTRLK